MAALQVDRDGLASNDPLLFRELQALCTLCRSKERCVLDLAQVRDEPGNQGLARILPQCHDAERSRRGAKLRTGGAIPADPPFHRLLGKRVIGSGQANALSPSMPRRNARCLQKGHEVWAGS